MLKDNDEDFHMLFRNHLILPYLHNSFSAEYAKERACARLSAFQKKNGGLRDGTTKCAQLLRAFDSEPSDGDQHAILEIDIVNAFNATARQAAFDTVLLKGMFELG